jgi:hypothetical protein
MRIHRRNLSREQVTRAVLNHEAVLMRVAGWSSPLRHLGALPIYGGAIDTDSSGEPVGTDIRVVVTARYNLAVRDPDRVVNLLRGRYAEDNIDGLDRALLVSVQAEGWDPSVLAGGAVQVETADVSIDVR